VGQHRKTGSGAAGSSVVRDEEAVALRARGKSFEEIAAALGYGSKSASFDAVNRGLARRVELNAPDRERLRQLELERCDALEAMTLQRMEATDNDFAYASLGNVLLGCRSRRAKLLGLDAPVKVEGKFTAEREMVAGVYQEVLAQVASGGGEMRTVAPGSNGGNGKAGTPN
jgi:hypothetical protein